MAGGVGSGYDLPSQPDTPETGHGRVLRHDLLRPAGVFCDAGKNRQPTIDGLDRHNWRIRVAKRQHDYEVPKAEFMKSDAKFSKMMPTWKANDAIETRTRGGSRCTRSAARACGVHGP
jgi:hypothetical protein